MELKQRNVRRSVSILVSRGWLQLRFSYGGTRHYLSVGLRDTPAKAINLKREVTAPECPYQ